MSTFEGGLPDFIQDNSYIKAIENHSPKIKPSNVTSLALKELNSSKLEENSLASIPKENLVPLRNAVSLINSNLSTPDRLKQIMNRKPSLGSQKKIQQQDQQISKLSGVIFQPQYNKPKQTRLHHKSSLDSQTTISSSSKKPAVQLQSIPAEVFSDSMGSQGKQFDSELQRQDSGSLSQIDKKNKFVRNCLSKDFGKVIRNGNIVQDDSLISWELHSATSSTSNSHHTSQYKQNRQNLIDSLRKRACGFMILNLFWLLIIVTTQIQSINLLDVTTFDAITMNLLNTAEDFSIVQIISYILSILIGARGILVCSQNCMRVYEGIMWLSILLEFTVNVLLLNLIPIAIVKCFFIAFFHSLFIFAARMVRNAMLVFEERYLEEITLTPTHFLQSQYNNGIVGSSTPPPIELNTQHMITITHQNIQYGKSI